MASNRDLHGDHSTPAPSTRLQQHLRALVHLTAGIGVCLVARRTSVRGFDCLQGTPAWHRRCSGFGRNGQKSDKHALHLVSSTNMPGN